MSLEQSKRDEKRMIVERKRNILHLISKYFKEIGLNDSNNKLMEESRLSSDYQVCDNIDLDTIYLDFISYYQLKFGKKPKIIKKIEDNNSNNQISSYNLKQSSKTIKKVKTNRNENLEEFATSKELDPALVVSSIFGNIEPLQYDKNDVAGDFISTNFSYRNSVSTINYPDDWKDLVDVVTREIVQTDNGVRWNNIFGAEDAINFLKEGVILPLEHPKLFQDLTKPWKSCLIYGPPGTGKTLIAQALCNETMGRVTFFNISPSTIISKWRGESEKIIRILFDVAKNNSPSIIFLDEIECITSQRDKTNEHEASKRFKNEFLSLLDCLDSANCNLFVLANTNLPWEVDCAFLRRFEKKILIDLPGIEERKGLIKFFLEKTTDDLCVEQLAKVSQNFTGDEIRIACKEIKMSYIRKAIATNQTQELQPAIHLLDAVEAFKQIKPVTSNIIQKYYNWNNI